MKTNPRRRFLAPLLAATALATSGCASPVTAARAANAGRPAANPLPAPTVEFEGKTYRRLGGDQLRARIVGHYLIGEKISPHSVIRVFQAGNVYTYSTGRDEVDGTYRIGRHAVQIEEAGRSYDLYIFQSPDGDILTGRYQDDGRITSTKSEIKPIIDRWTAESGAAQAAAVVAKCLEAAPDTHSGRRTCVLAAFEACEDEHGTSQRQMNDCGTFSRQAWEARLAAARARLMAARPAGSRPRSPNQLIARFAQSQRRWDAWNLPDCETQAALSQGGTYHRYDLDICLSNHAAYRTIELETLIETWAKVFKL